MKKMLVILCLIALPVQASGLFDDIDREVLGKSSGLYDDILGKNNSDPYKDCKTNECRTAIYRARMQAYNDLERLYLLQMMQMDMLSRQNMPLQQMPNNQIQYGYNAVGDYVPVSIGGRKINYGYNSVGDYVPLSF